MLLFAVILFMGSMGIIKILVLTTIIIKGNYNSLTTYFPMLFGRHSQLISVVAEYLTALALIAGALELYMTLKWGLFIALLALTFLIYLSLKSFGWRIDVKEGFGNEIYNIFGFIGGAVSIIILILYFQ